MGVSKSKKKNGQGSQLENNQPISLKLRTLQTEENNANGTPYFHFKEFSLGDLNLLIGDNAQGKTRLMRTLSFLHTVALGTPNKLATSFKAELKFVETVSGDEIEYSLSIRPNGGQGNTYAETVVRNDRILLSTAERILIEEESNQSVGQFFIPENLPAISSVRGDYFYTIDLIRDFLRRMLFLWAERKREFVIDDAATKPNNVGTNLSAVLLNWSANYKNAYKGVLDEFKRCFKFVDNVQFIDLPMSPKAKVIAFSEKGISNVIPELEWSDGMVRTLILLMFPQTNCGTVEKPQTPSLICIDEIENGLDYKTLRHIIDLYKDTSALSQVVMASHSPLVCNLVAPDSWRIVKRSNAVVRVFAPSETENLEEEMKNFKDYNWDFYRKHIATSALYAIKDK